MNFNRFQECKDESFIIPSSLFQIVKPFAFVEIHYELNETKSKHFFEKLQKFTNNSFRMAIMWKTRNRRAFSTKDIVLVIYVTLVKPNVIRKLDEVNIIIQL